MSVFHLHLRCSSGRRSVVGTATGYRLEVSELETQWRKEIFSSPPPSRLVVRPTQSFCAMETELFPGVKVTLVWH